uniref:KUOX1-like n=1 Tax=Tarenaya spinosa TaxID=228870 RepID=T1SFY0_9ROSI|nr:KUOX1-like [Tarenaya spinosa]
MKNEKGASSSEFSMGNTAQERGLPYVPDCYVVPPPCRPENSESESESSTIPRIDVSRLMTDGEERRQVVEELAMACRRLGFFQIVNHGISQSILDEALSAAAGFFELPAKEKEKLMSNDVYNPVRYGTSLKDGLDKIQFWRIFLKHYAHPLDKYIHLWPGKPSGYREKMGKFCDQVRKLSVEIMGAITESLGLGRDYMSSHMGENGTQVTAVNCYPPCPQPEMALGLPPHSDYSCITILLQSLAGLEILEPEAHGGARSGGPRRKIPTRAPPGVFSRWIAVPNVKGALQVHVGDHVEVLSNGLYKSVVHRATLNRNTTRISIASLHSLGMDEKMTVPDRLVNDQNPVRYRESSFNDFLEFLAKNDLARGRRFIDTLRIKN